MSRSYCYSCARCGEVNETIEIEIPELNGTFHYCKVCGKIKKSLYDLDYVIDIIYSYWEEMILEKQRCERVFEKYGYKTTDRGLVKNV